MYEVVFSHFTESFYTDLKSLARLQNLVTALFQKIVFSHGAIQNIQIQLVTKPCRLCPMGS